MSYFDVFPAILPALSTPVKPEEITSSDWATLVDESISVELAPAIDEAFATDLGFITPHVSDLAQVVEASQLNVLAFDLATLVEALGARGFIAYEYGSVIDEAVSVAFESLDLVIGAGLAYFTPYASDLLVGAEVISVLDILTRDGAIGADTYKKAFEALDRAVGIETLGDRTFSSLELFRGLETHIKQFPSSDFAKAVDSGQLFLGATDSVLAFEYVPERAFILVDLAKGFERLIERYLEVIDLRLGIDRVVVEFEDSYLKVLYFSFNIYGFVHIYSIDNFTPPFVVEARLSPWTAKDHDARLDLYHTDKLGYHPADAYGSYLHAWGGGDSENDPFTGLFAWGFRDTDTDLLNQSLGVEFGAKRWYVFRIIQKADETVYEVYDSRRNKVANTSHGEGHSVDLKVVLGMCNEDNQSFVQEVWYDWAFVRKYIEPEPTVSIGAEETSPVEW